MILNRVLILTGCLALFSGCSTMPTEPVPLTARQLETLSNRARGLEDLGIGVKQDEDQTTRLTNIRNFTLGASAKVPLNSRSHRTARFPIVRMQVNGKLVMALVDTGSSVSLINFHAAERLGIVPVKHDHVATSGPSLMTRHRSSPGGRVEYFIGMAHSVDIGKLKIYNMPFGIMNNQYGFNNFWWLDGYRVEAILGHDMMQSLSHVTLDFYGGSLSLAAQGKHRPNPDKLVAAIPFIFEQGLPTMKAVIGDSAAAPIPVVVDTGASFGLWVPHSLAGKLNLLPDSSSGAYTGSSLGGETKFHTAGLHNLNLSGFTIKRVPVVVATRDQGAEELDYALLGIQVLNDFVVTFDYGARKLYFEDP